MKKKALFVLLLIIVAIAVMLTSRLIDRHFAKPYNDVKRTSVSLPIGFEFEETERRSIEAHKLREQRRYLESVIAYNKAREIEPMNLKLLFDQSESYARLGDLNRAMELLDTAIMVDNSYAALYNNRGLIKYKLARNEEAIEDYRAAITIDSLMKTVYYNMALAYWKLEDDDNLCFSIDKAVSLGFKLSGDPLMKRIYKTRCNH